MRNSVETPIFVDEGCFCHRDALKIISNQSADGIAIKFMKSGGIHNANVIYEMAKAYNLDCVASCMFESPISLTAMASFAASKKIKFVDLDPLNMIKYNPIVGGARLDGTKVMLSDKPGLGIESLGEIEVLFELH